MPDGAHPRHPDPRVDRLLARLARRTSSGRYLPEVDGLRFVSIVMVLVFHVAVVTALVHGNGETIGTFGQATRPLGDGWLMSILRQGSFGVNIFFIISGFVLALPFLAARLTDGEPVSLKRYALRRLTRIEPPYLVVMTGAFVALWLVGTAPAFSHYGAGMLYLHQSWFGIANPVNAASWTLEVEMQFYLVVPLLALVFGSRNTRVRRMSLVLCCLLASAFQA
jgi:peptidoglycan/LPS O-acetylase OafA/YrhL